MVLCTLYLKCEDNSYHSTIIFGQNVIKPNVWGTLIVSLFVTDCNGNVKWAIMFGVYHQICRSLGRGNGFSLVVVFVVTSYVLDPKFTSGELTLSSEETGIETPPDDFNVENASDDEIKARLKEFGVHYSLESILNILELEARKDETIKILLAKYREEQHKTPQSVPPPLFRHPIISIDGFFTHGRTKVAKMVASALHGRRMLMPTRHIARLRNYITSPQLRKHYYSLSKYMGANLAKLYCRTAPVILERYWHDQVAYVVAKTFNASIPENSTIYNFPEDLLVPDMMFFVNGALNHKVHNESTEAEHVNNELSERIAENFRRIRPKPIEIGPPSLPPPMVKKILAIFDKVKTRFLPKPLQRPNWRNH